MKKVILLTILLVVAASATITVEFPDGAPTTVGVPVRVVITSDAVDNVDLFVNPGQETWAYPTEVDLTQTGPTTFVYDGDIEITHPGTNITLYASKGAETGQSSPFTVVEGPAAKWQIIAPGETAVPGDATEPDGKTGSGSVTAGDDNTYTINICDKWYNVVSGPDTPSLTTTDLFDKLPATPVVGDNIIQLRTVDTPGAASGTQTVIVSGGSYTSDESDVTVNVGTASYLLILCNGEDELQGDDATIGVRGKTGEPVDATLGDLYLVEIRAVDDCWNWVPTYDEDDNEVNVYAGTVDLTDATTDLISGGHATDVNVDFKDVKVGGEYIDAEDSYGLKTDYSTEVVVLPGIDSSEVSLSPSTVPVGVHSDLEVRAWVAGAPLTLGSAIAKLIDGPAAYFHILEDTFQIQDGFGSTEVWGDTVGIYCIEVTTGALTDTVCLTVEERPGVTVIPNPFKYGAEGHDDIGFSYKVAEAGAAEVLLLITDIYGNVVYKVTYTSGEEVMPGTQEISWDGTNSNGNRIASGMYQAVMKITLTDLSSEVMKKNFMVIW